MATNTHIRLVFLLQSLNTSTAFAIKSLRVLAMMSQGSSMYGNFSTIRAIAWNTKAEIIPVMKASHTPKVLEPAEIATYTNKQQRIEISTTSSSLFQKKFISHESGELSLPGVREAPLVRVRAAPVAHHVALDEQRRKRPAAHREERVEQHSGEEERAAGTRHAHRAAHVEAQEAEEQKHRSHCGDLLVKTKERVLVCYREYIFCTKYICRLFSVYCIS